MCLFFFLLILFYYLSANLGASLYVLPSRPTLREKYRSERGLHRTDADANKKMKLGYS